MNTLGTPLEAEVPRVIWAGDRISSRVGDGGRPLPLRSSSTHSHGPPKIHIHEAVVQLLKQGGDKEKVRLPDCAGKLSQARNIGFVRRR
jgi:hypothetical protein